MGSGPSTNTNGLSDQDVSISGDVDEVDSRMESSEDTVILKGQQLSVWVIQELALQQTVPRSQRDEVLHTLCSCVCDILEKHRILFNGMVTRIEIKEYRAFSSVANELFEANSNNESFQMKITWGRVVALFAFAVRLSQEYHYNQSRVNDITRFLATYVTKHVISFVRENGGWNGLVEHFPGTETDDGQFRRAILWSGLCVGIAATMYITSLLR